MYMRYKSCNCIFCNCSHSEDNPITKDHIPSKVIYKDERIDEQRITVPCCYKCNQAFSIEENFIEEIFKELRNENYNCAYVKKLINNNPHLGFVIRKIALGYKYHWTGKPVYEDKIANVDYLIKGINDSEISEFNSMPLKEVCSYIDNIHNVPYALFIDIADPSGETRTTKCCGLIENTGNLLNEYFWHYYDKIANTIKFAFYNKLFVKVTFE